MNKTLMLVICDFLLLSMLALARFDPPEEPPVATLDATASSATAEAELIELLEESLASELTSRENLNEDLAETREDLQAKARALEATQQTLEQKSVEAEALAITKAKIEAAQKLLTAEKNKVEADRAKLAERFEDTRTQLESANTERVQLATTLGQLKEESSVAKERLNQSEEELIAREIALVEREAALKAAEEDKRRLTKEREALSSQLQVAQAERRILEQNLTQEQREKQLLQTEKEAAFARADRLGENVSELGQGVTQLGEGVTQLGEGVNTIKAASDKIQKEIEDARPQTMSEIFTRFQKNRATIRFTAMEKNTFGSVKQRSYESKSILIKDTEGTTYLVTHTNDTPFAFSKNPNNISAISLSVSIAGRSLTINQVGFLGTDPRLLFIPLAQQVVTQTGLETFPLALQPERWEEAVLVKNDESNFGRTGFRRLTSSDRFLKMDRPTLGELFSEFASSRGDLAFTKNGQFIGALTDTNYAVVINSFLAAGVINIGSSYNAADHDNTIDRLKDRVRKLPSEVQ
ncbi:MAG: hypothetical protein ACN4GF_08435 [Lentimonas sp.]